MRVLWMVVLAIFIGFVSYRAALATMPPEQYGAASVPNCAGAVSPAHFDAVTGFPVTEGCTFGDGQGTSMLYASTTMYGHFARSVWFGFAVVPVTLLALWWFDRRRRHAFQPPSGALTSA